MPIGSCIVHSACMAKVHEIQNIFDTGQVKIMSKDVGINAETWETVQSYCKCDATYVSSPDGDYLLYDQQKQYRQTFAEPEHPFPNEIADDQSIIGSIESLKFNSATT